jgi:hypothetical protein
MYASALGAIALIPAADRPAEFIAASIGVNLLSNIVDRIAHGERISDEKLQEEVEAAIDASNISHLLTTNDFYRALSRILRSQDEILSAAKANEYTLQQLTSQMGELLLFLRERQPSAPIEYPLPCPGRIFPSVTQLGHMMASHPCATGNRDANRPIRGERRPVRSPMAQPPAGAGTGFSAQFPGVVAHG